MRIIDIPYLNITGPDRKWPTDPPRSSSQAQQLTLVLFPQCNRKETTFCTSPSQRNGRPVTSTSSLVPLVKHLLTPVMLLFEFLFVNFVKKKKLPSGNIQVSWIDDTSAFVSLSQTDQVQIGECGMGGWMVEPFTC